MLSTTHRHTRGPGFYGKTPAHEAESEGAAVPEGPEERVGPCGARVVVLQGLVCESRKRCFPSLQRRETQTACRPPTERLIGSRDPSLQPHESGCRAAMIAASEGCRGGRYSGIHWERAKNAHAASNYYDTDDLHHRSRSRS